jgi:hypothetical protein
VAARAADAGGHHGDRAVPGAAAPAVRRHSGRKSSVSADRPGLASPVQAPRRGECAPPYACDGTFQALECALRRIHATAAHQCTAPPHVSPAARPPLPLPAALLRLAAATQRALLAKPLPRLPSAAQTSALAAEAVARLSVLQDAVARRRRVRSLCIAATLDVLAGVAIGVALQRHTSDAEAAVCHGADALLQRLPTRGCVASLLPLLPCLSIMYMCCALPCVLPCWR